MHCPGHSLLGDLHPDEGVFLDRPTVVDRPPAVYCLIVAADLEFQSARVNVMTVLVTLWGIRLTFNYALICLILSAR